jgi:hypothetical protein
VLRIILGKDKLDALTLDERKQAVTVLARRHRHVSSLELRAVGRCGIEDQAKKYSLTKQKSFGSLPTGRLSFSSTRFFPLALFLPGAIPI